MTQTGLIPDIIADPVGTLTPEPVDQAFAIITSEGFWKRAGIIVVGAFLVIVGTVIAVSGTKAVKDIGNAALAVGSKVATKGAV